MSKGCLFQYDSEEELEIYRTYGRTLESFEEDVRALKKWAKTQLHLPEMPPDVLIKSFLRGNKCSVERVKQRIDMYYTLRNFASDLFRHPLCLEIQEQRKYFKYAPLPNLTKDLYRVFVFQFTKECPESYSPTLVANYVTSVFELKILEDVSLGVILVADFSNITLRHIIKVPPTLLKKMSALFENAYNDRQKACHVIYSGIGADTVLGILKTALSAKLRERVFLHKNYEGLYDYIPKKILPRDYEGEEKSLEELSEMVHKKQVKYNRRFKELERLKTDELKRPGKPVNDDFFGFYGNFKQLQVD